MTNIPDEVVRRFAFQQGLRLDDARAVFSTLESFLDVASRRKVTPSPEIDVAWHCFLLHTKHYERFCRHRYGRMVHHTPRSPLLCNADGQEGESSLSNNRQGKCLATGTSNLFGRADIEEYGKCGNCDGDSPAEIEADGEALGV